MPPDVAKPRRSQAGDFDRARFGQNLLAARQRAGLTQDQLAARLGCSRYLLGKAERGRGTLGLPCFARLAKLLREPTDRLLAGTV